MTLRQARCRFTAFIPSLINKAIELGYDVALDEGMDRPTAKDPTTDHMKGSLHELGLAQDIVLYQKSDGTYITEGTGYIDLGEFWKSLDPLCKWGGDFVMKDYDHFSYAPPEVIGNRK